MATERHPRVGPGVRANAELRRALGDFAAAAVRNDAVDPITTELVRLRCATHHDCHTWLSLRSAVAKQQGLDEALVAQVAADEPDLTEAQLVALELADILMVDPAGVTADFRARLTAHFTRAQVIELALDVMKWSYQKVPVALGTDVEVVPGELTDLEFDADGRWIAGRWSPPAASVTSDSVGVEPTP